MPSENFVTNLIKPFWNAGTGVLATVNRLGLGSLGLDPDRVTNINEKLIGSGDEVFGNNPYAHIEASPTVITPDLKEVENANKGKYNYNFQTGTNFAGNAIGSLAAFILGTKGFGAAGLGEKAAMYANVMATSYEPTYQNISRVMPSGTNELTKNLLTLLQTGLTAAAFEFLPKEKLGLTIGKTEAKEFAEIVKNTPPKYNHDP